MGNQSRGIVRKNHQFKYKNDKNIKRYIKRQKYQKRYKEDKNIMNIIIFTAPTARYNITSHFHRREHCSLHIYRTLLKGYRLHTYIIQVIILYCKHSTPVQNYNMKPLHSGSKTICTAHCKLHTLPRISRVLQICDGQVLQLYT